MSTMPKNLKRSLSGQTLITTSINIEGFLSTKSDILQEICQKNACAVYMRARDTSRQGQHPSENKGNEAGNRETT